MLFFCAHIAFAVLRARGEDLAMIYIYKRGQETYYGWFPVDLGCGDFRRVDLEIWEKERGGGMVRGGSYSRFIFWFKWSSVIFSTCQFRFSFVLSFSPSIPHSISFIFFGPPFILVLHPFFEFLLFSSFSFFVSFFFCVWLKHVRNTLHILILIPNVVEFVVIYDMWNCIFL